MNSYSALGIVEFGRYDFNPVATTVGNSTRTADVVLHKQPKKVMLNAYKDILER